MAGLEKWETCEEFSKFCYDHKLDYDIIGDDVEFYNCDGDLIFIRHIDDLRKTYNAR